MNIKYSMIFITLLLICLVLTMPCYADMYVIKDIDGKVICLTNINKISQEQIEAGCTISLLFKSSNSNKTPSQLETTPASESSTEEQKTKAEVEAQIKELENQPKADVVFVDSTNRLSNTGNYYYLEGILKNKGKGTAYHVEVEIRSLDKNNKLVSIGSGYANPTTIASGKEATYQIMIRFSAEIKSFDKMVSWNNTY